MSVATLAGEFLDDSGSVGWALTPGLEPFRRVFNVERRIGLKMFENAAGGETELVIGDETFKVFILSTAPGTNPNSIGLVVSDVRWKLRKAHIVRDFNLRRRTGRIRLVGEGRIEDQARALDVDYASWSLNNGTVWTVFDALENVLNEIGVGYVLPGIARQIPFENVILDDAGDLALGKILRLIPGYQLFVTRGGLLTLKDALDGSEAEVIENAGPIEFRTGSYEVADRRYERPASVVVLFDRECELRFDFAESESITQERGREPLILENVLRSPDVQIKVDGRDVSEGEYITFDEAYKAWASGWKFKPRGNLSNELMRRYYLKPSRLGLYTLPAKGVKPDRVLSQRIAAARGSFRKVYRISPAWMQKIRSVRGYRLGIFDAETGTLSNSKAYMSWVEVPTERGLGVTTAGHVNTETWSYIGYADLLKNATASPGIVNVIDNELGIIQTIAGLDAAGNVAKIIPGQLVDESGNVDTGPQLSAAAAFAATLAGFQLRDGFKMSTVLAATQGAPNSTARMHAVTITPAQAGAALGVTVGEAKGPTMFVRIQPSDTTTARFIWTDEDADLIKEAFFTGGAIPARLLVNADQINALALAAAAQVYELMQDREEGSAVHGQVSGLNPTGGVGSVESFLSSRGGARTRVTVPRRQVVRSLLSLIPSETRAAIIKQVQP